MRAIKPVIQLAKERALFRFSALAIRMLEDASVSIGQLKLSASSAHEQKTVFQAKEWLATQGPIFLKRLYASYCGYVERGMLTMYHDLRKQESQGLSADTWALIDDDTIMRQIEVERRVLRLRDADQISLGRLNLMIAQLHDEHDVRERENPFRPYLMARALHDVLCEMSHTSDLCAMLFDHLSGALATQLPEYFAAICEVFESNGVHARLLARPSSMSRRDREMLMSPQNHSTQNYAGNSQSAGMYMAGGTAHAAAPPELERVLVLLQQGSAEMQNTFRTPQQESQAMLQDFVWKIFNQTTQDRSQSHSAHKDGAQDGVFKPHPLNSQLHRLQRKAAMAEDVQDDAIHLFDLHEELKTERLNEVEHIALDVVAMLFNFIANDASIPPAFRAAIVRLQVPFLKAALQTPAILEKADHPFKKLLNRMASLAVELDAQVSPGKEIHREMTQLADTILAEFNDDTAIFSTVLKQLDEFVEQSLRECDAEISGAVSALQEAEKDPQRQDVLIVQTANALRERLLTIETDQRAADFIVKIWARVLLHTTEHTEIDAQPYRDVVPDLIWSVQTHDATERSALMQLLPKLVKRVKEGLLLIGMSEAASRQALDDLVAMHAAVLGAIQAVPLRKPTSLAHLHQHFSSLRIGDDNVGETVLHAPAVSHIHLQAALQKFEVSAHLHLDSDAGNLLGSDINWLGNMQTGTSIEWWDGHAYQPARLMWISPALTFYMFKLTALQDEQNQQGQLQRLLIYSSISLIKALREGSIGMLEYAPLFDRAIESLLSTDHARQRIAI